MLISTNDIFVCGECGALIWHESAKTHKDWHTGGLGAGVGVIGIAGDVG